MQMSLINGLWLEFFLMKPSVRWHRDSRHGLDGPVVWCLRFICFINRRLGAVEGLGSRCFDSNLFTRTRVRQRSPRTFHMLEKRVLGIMMPLNSLLLRGAMDANLSSTFPAFSRATKPTFRTRRISHRNLMIFDTTRGASWVETSSDLH